MQRFIESLVAADRSPATVAAYAKHLAHFAAWFYQWNTANLTLENLTATDVREYRAQLLKAKLSPSTINLRLCAIRAFAKFGGIDIGTVRGLQMERPAPRWIDRHDQARILRAVDLAVRTARDESQTWRQCIRDRAMITLLLHSGLRLGELCALDFSDVEINARSGAVDVRQGKGFKTRRVPLNADARKALADWLQLRRADVEALFTGQQGRLSHAGAWGVVRRYARRAGVTVTPHMLRHTFAKSMVDADTPIEQVAALMGHNDLSTTRRYTLPSADDLQRAVERIAG